MINRKGDGTMGDRRAQKTGYNDRTGRAIRDGDRVRGIVGGLILCGTVYQEDDGVWRVESDTHVWSPYLWAFDEVEVLP